MTETPSDAKGAPAPAGQAEERRGMPEGEPRLRRAEDELRARFAEELEEGEETQDRVAASREAIVELDHVSLAFDRPILENVSLVARRGETVVIAGESGTGKSTILKLILRLLRPDSGRVIVDGEVLNDVTYEEALVIRQKMGMVFQGAALFDSMSVFENVAFPLREHTQLSDDEIEARVREKLEFVDLDPDRVMDQLPAELSGGMKKRVGIARGMAVNPAIMLYDEPTSGLDPLTTGTITRLIMKLQRELKVTSIVVSHDIRSAFRMATKIALLAERRIVFFGSPEEMTASPDRYVQDFLGGV
jgi:phospholipid/cholesterol/gamma-HCH transport system ATP-binding protein